MLKKFTRLMMPVLLVSLLFPVFHVEAGDSGTYRYRSTKMGIGTVQTKQWEYEITKEKYDFTTKESVFALTRIFAIKDIKTFQFKYEVRGGTNRDALSPIYRPNKNWWAEIWYWDNFGKLPAGKYALNVMISIDGGRFTKIESKSFAVSGENIYDPSFDYNSEYNNKQASCQKSSYNYKWMKTGKSVEGLGAHAYEMKNETSSFRTNENVFAMVNNTSIKGVDHFRVKFDVFINGDYFLKSVELDVQNPKCHIWAYNYAWANLGTMPTGTHKVYSFIKIDNGSYKQLDSKKIHVTPAVAYNSNTNQLKPKTLQNHPRYNYSWTQMDSNIQAGANYHYMITNPRTVFTNREEIKVLTRISEVSNISSFKIRHDLYSNGNFDRKIESAERVLGVNPWNYHYTQSNFGRLSGGEYEIKVYISIDEQAWQQIDIKKFSVSGGSAVSDNLNYDWTQIGTSKDFVNTGLYSFSYPDYVRFPFSQSQF